MEDQAFSKRTPSVTRSSEFSVEEVVVASTFYPNDNFNTSTLGIIVNATNDGKETRKLLPVGFEHVFQKDDLLFFRKRK